MSLTPNLILGLTAFLFAVNLVLVFLLLLKRWEQDRDLPRSTRKQLGQYIRRHQAVQLTPELLVENWQSLRKGKHQKEKDPDRLVTSLMHQLRFGSGRRRKEAAVMLGHIGTEHARTTLEKSLSKEREYSVKLYYADGLLRIGNPSSIPFLVDSLRGAPPDYRTKVHSLLVEFGEPLQIYLPELMQQSGPEITDLLLHIAGEIPDGRLREYLHACLQSSDESVAYRAASTMRRVYPRDLINDRQHGHPNPAIRNEAILALAEDPTLANLKQAYSFLADESLSLPARRTMGAILEKRPRFMQNVIQWYHAAEDDKLRRRLGSVLVTRIEFLFHRLLSRDREAVRPVLADILGRGKVSEAIGFLSRNQNREIENEILAILKEALVHNEEARDECRTYLDARILEKIGLEPLLPPAIKREEKRDKAKTFYLAVLLVAIISLFPAAYLLRHFELLGQAPFLGQLKIFAVDSTYYLAFYSAIVNGIYYLLLIFSAIGVFQQSRSWRLKLLTLLFRKNLVPSISIIAPAYGEEATIIESANSLLNLIYPEYELIIANDGSKDATLNVLIDYFQLQRVDREINEVIPTRPIRGIYINPSHPKLIVVDKENGGKADSLNAGINVSRHEFFCGIDADSLLEPDALLKLASQTLDQDEESVALGGNIFPINGCKVDRGMIHQYGIPANTIARFQTIEYIRAFMAGRVGWAQLRSLLIISGAFGLFRKKRILEIGGYLTSSGKYKKDTVGEDMELVVRLGRHMHEERIPHRIHYAFNANCWTEVPEDSKILYRQRDRWHRGLLDILSFHRKVTFNPAYGAMGLVAMPYFFLFEMVGPMIEMQGYLMVFIAALFGLLTPKIVLLLFLTTIMMGTVISLASLLISETEEKRFRFKELMTLVWYAIIENFGPRQVASFWRVTGYFNAMKKPKGWGKMVRKGFSTSTPPGKS